MKKNPGLYFFSIHSTRERRIKGVYSCLFVFVLFLASPAISQDSGGMTGQSSTSPFTEVFIFGGGGSGSNTVYGLSDIRKMAPSSVLLKEDFSSYNSYPGDQYFSNSSFGVSLGFIPGAEKRAQGAGSPLMRFGLLYEDGGYFDLYLYRTLNDRYDTLYNSQGESVYFRDSVHEDYCYTTYYSSSLQLDFSVLLRTDTRRRWMFYAGAGVSAGMTFNNRLDISRGNYDYLAIYPEGSSFDESSNWPPENYSDDFSYETVRTGSSWVLQGYFPLGIDFRLGRKTDFLRRSHLFSEMRPGIRMMDIPDAKNYTGTYISGIFGVSYRWN